MIGFLFFLAFSNLIFSLLIAPHRTDQNGDWLFTRYTTLSFKIFVVFLFLDWIF